jgi:hypothetical protein
MVSYDENEDSMLRQSVQNDRVNLDFFHCEGCGHVRATEFKSGWTELSSANWPSPVCPLEFGLW